MSISSTSSEDLQCGLVVADVAADTDSCEVDLKQRSKTAKFRKSAGRVSTGETRANALFTPNTNYYAPLSIVKSPKKQVSGYLEPGIEDIQVMVNSERNNSPGSAEKECVGKTGSEIVEKKFDMDLERIREENLLQSREDYLAKLFDGEFGDEEGQPTGLFESSVFQSSPFEGMDKGKPKEANFKNFLEKQPEDFTLLGISQGSRIYEPSPIPKASNITAPGLQETPVRSSVAAAFRETRGDIVDKLTMAANDATNGLDDHPTTSGRAKEIAQNLEETVRSGSSFAPLPATSLTNKSEAPTTANWTVDTTTSVHIHYRLNVVPTVRNVSKVAPIIDTTSANVRNLRNRWEVSSSSGAPLHPDQDEDDLLQAARQMLRDAKQARKPRVRPMSYYEPHEAVEVSCEKNTLACASRALSTGSVYAPEMEVSREKPSVVFESPKDDEKGVKRGISSAENDDDDVFTAEKKMKREENDVTKLSGHLVVEALEAFNFLNETANRTPSFLSSILDGTSESQHPVVLEAPKMLEKDSDNDGIPLVHTVSLYRKKRKVLKCVGETTVLGQFTTSPSQSSGSHAELSSLPNEISEEEKIALERKRLVDAIRVQDEQILQASKAFTHCRKNLEFKGSCIEVDAQRALLVATESRRALVSALDNLLQSYASGTHVKESNKPRGTLTIKDISLRLTRAFVNGHVNYHNDQMLYYFIVLIRHEDAVHHTAMVTSDDGLQSGNIAFPHYIQLRSLPHNFTCTLEVYALRTKRDIIGHSKTAKKATRLQSFRQGFFSLGTLSAVVDPSFQKIGKLTLNIGSVIEGNFHLTDVMSPLDGAVTMILTCFPEEFGTIGYKGFLSLYQKVEAIASWTRFWCVLSDGNLRFWKYPEDETTKKPVVIINLRDSASEEIRSLSAESCPYPHSMTIDVWIESAFKKGKREKIRIMMAADTKEDMQQWLTVLNGSLRNIMLWYPKH